MWEALFFFLSFFFSFFFLFFLVTLQKVCKTVPLLPSNSLVGFVHDILSALLLPGAHILALVTSGTGEGPLSQCLNNNYLVITTNSAIISAEENKESYMGWRCHLGRFHPFTSHEGP